MKKLQQIIENIPVLNKAYYLLYGFLEKVNRDHVSAFSAQAAFFLLLSVFPALMILLNLTRFMPFTQEDVIELIINVIPYEFASPLTSIIEDLYAQSKASLLSVSVILTLWSAAKGMQAIAKGLDAINECEQYLGYIVWRLVGMLYTILLIALVAMTLCLFVFGNAIYSGLVSAFPHLRDIAAMLIGVRSVIGVLLLFVFFLFLYTYLPSNRGIRMRDKMKRKLRYQAYGSAFSAAAWILLSYAFSIYIDRFSGFSYAYGSLTTIMLALLWLYFCMYIVFIGAEINVYLNWKRHELLALWGEVRGYRKDESSREET